ncbi:hypothetical protein PB2503_06992 [Parvularcula bermudensis HTCC2503]|uniref:Glutaminase n=1 Tax=Parvularcula bermudensis (strain ATCC BAA-594 / HTCC2503 / KCTC 12087) TaxID=314260 RepID=E0TE89_PARBH|nr:glutaminase [Parvularcula bermudensis]ADM09464.1 hypothetical protein PB2503_06992 [Parvularcula bermudensis HTCC2503]
MTGPAEPRGHPTPAAQTNRLSSFGHIDWQQTLDDICTDILPHLGKGQVADYIPALASANPKAFGIAFSTIEGTTYTAGDWNTAFSIQSISKVFMLSVALAEEGEKLWRRVGREPSGSSFNSIVQLEREHGRPRNPFINAGALVVTDTVISHCGDEAGIDRLLAFLRESSGDQAIVVDEKIARSEAAYGDRNRALAYFMKSFGILREDVPITLETYFRQCAIEMSVANLSKAGLYLAAEGLCPISNRAVANDAHTNRVNAIMMLCGHYDRSGDFAYRVGLAGKSGVGGGIIAIIPGVGCVAVWSPPLNDAGNSYAGTLALEWFSHRTGVNLF